MLELVQSLASPLISIVLSPDMTHNSYNDEKDLLRPLQDYFTRVFPKDKVCEPVLQARLARYTLSRSSIFESHCK